MTPTLETRWLVFDPPVLDPSTDDLHTAARDDIDALTAELASADLEAVNAERAPSGQVVVSVGDRFVDLQGLRVLVEASDRARASGTNLVVLSPPRSLCRMVEILGLEARLSLVVAIPALAVLGTAVAGSLLAATIPSAAEQAAPAGTSTAVRHRAQAGRSRAARAADVVRRLRPWPTRQRDAGPRRGRR